MNKPPLDLGVHMFVKSNRCVCILYANKINQLALYVQSFSKNNCLINLRLENLEN